MSFPTAVSNRWFTYHTLRKLKTCTILVTILMFLPISLTISSGILIVKSFATFDKRIYSTRLCLRHNQCNYMRHGKCASSLVTGVIFITHSGIVKKRLCLWSMCVCLTQCHEDIQDVLTISYYHNHRRDQSWLHKYSDFANGSFLWWLVPLIIHRPSVYIPFTPEKMRMFRAWSYFVLIWYRSI